MKTIRVSQSFSSSSLDLLKEKSFFNIKEGFTEPDQSCEGLIVRSKDLVNEKLLKKFPSCKAVVSATSGFDHFDVSLVDKYPNIFFGHSPNANVTSCSELTLMHALNLFKLKNNHLKDRSEFNFGTELKEKTALIIGFGRIGKQTSVLFKALGMNVIACDPYIFKKDFADLKVEPVTIKEGLNLADLISLHCPLTKKTSGMVNSEFLDSMKKGSFLINCARGELVNEASLIDALKNGALKGAALDVFEQEPLSKESPLRLEQSAHLSPHIGGYTQEAHKKSASEALIQVESVINNTKSEVLSPLPVSTEWYKDLGPDAY